MKRILVVGSLNMDIVIETPCMPKAGETIAGKSIAQIPGGKGANQAFAAGKLGGNIAMMGAVGNDEKGEKLLESLKGVGVDISRIEVMNDIPTGQAFITVDDQGENAIIIIATTNNNAIKNVNNIIIQFLLKIIFSYSSIKEIFSGSLGTMNHRLFLRFRQSILRKE